MKWTQLSIATNLSQANKPEIHDHERRWGCMWPWNLIFTWQGKLIRNPRATTAAAPIFAGGHVSSCRFCHVAGCVIIHTTRRHHFQSQSSSTRSRFAHHKVRHTVRQHGCISSYKMTPYLLSFCQIYKIIENRKMRYTPPYHMMINFRRFWAFFTLSCLSFLSSFWIDTWTPSLSWETF